MAKVYQTELSLNSNFSQKLIIQTQFCLANPLKHEKLRFKFGKLYSKQKSEIERRNPKSKNPKSSHFPFGNLGGGGGWFLVKGGVADGFISGLAVGKVAD